MRFAPIVAAALLVAPVAAYAHPKLVSATPAPGSVAAPTATVQLVFSESLVAQFSGADLVMTDMPGMKMNTPMKMPASAALGADGKTLIVTLPRALTAGGYKLSYHVVSTDTHRVEGNYSFRVR
ncbi:copper homeostasis periplasmic binding protein CopC [uncultured Sphingomonas sp.]|uniref:copper homeostasis periplasmic binding protein CopC n=1 Tax=uncultured Sphingomonas sp. TaxID=158754 RepID=UPI00262C04DB|nr:copper homeostasis periplasmic binding protein CopC [uncultured Sphingomonas sp.]